MVTMTCKCGKTSMTFNNMQSSDFPNGWKTDCCLEAPPVKEVVIDSPVPEKVKPEVNKPSKKSKNRKR